MHNIKGINMLIEDIWDNPLDINSIFIIYLVDCLYRNKVGINMTFQL